MAFDIANPATYDEGFKSYLRQKSYAGREDVSVDELQSLYSDYSSKQEQDTKTATKLLSNVAPDTVKQEPEKVDPADEFRLVVQDRILPAIDAIKQKRSAASGIDNTWKRKMEQDNVDQLAATRINDLVATGLITSQDADVIRVRADNSKGLTYEESLRGFLFDRMNPQKSGPPVSLAVKDPETANKIVTTAKSLNEFGFEKEAQDILTATGLVGQRDDVTEAKKLLQENQEMMMSQQNRQPWTDPTNDEVLDSDKIQQRMAQNQARLSGMSARLAKSPSREGEVINIFDLVKNYETEKDGKKAVNATQLNKGVKQLSEKFPGLLVITQTGGLVPATEFQYQMGSADNKETSPDRGYGLSGKGAGKLVRDAVRGSVEGVKKANTAAADALYQTYKGVASGDVNLTTIPGVGVSTGWLKDFTDAVAGKDEQDR